MPVIHVHAAPQRNQNSARGRSSGLTAFFVGPSIFPWNGVLTKLKKYRWPIHAMPAITWAQRKKSCRNVFKSFGIASPHLKLVGLYEGSMDKEFEGRVAIVTGASGGIGRATAELFEE